MSKQMEVKQAHALWDASPSGLRAGPKGANPRSSAKPDDSRTQASKGEMWDGAVGTSINARGLVVSGLKQAGGGTDGHQHRDQINLCSK
jgi:hypothetical protein